MITGLQVKHNLKNLGFCIWSLYSSQYYYIFGHYRQIQCIDCFWWAGRVKMSHPVRWIMGGRLVEARARGEFRRRLPLPPPPSLRPSEPPNQPTFQLLTPNYHQHSGKGRSKPMNGLGLHIIAHSAVVSHHTTQLSNSVKPESAALSHTLNCINKHTCRIPQHINSETFVTQKKQAIIWNS